MAVSSISKFFEKSLKERLGVVADFSGLSQDELKIIEDATGGISYDEAVLKEGAGLSTGIPEQTTIISTEVNSSDNTIDLVEFYSMGARVTGNS